MKKVYKVILFAVHTFIVSTVIVFLLDIIIGYVYFSWAIPIGSTIGAIIGRCIMIKNKGLDKI